MPVLRRRPPKGLLRQASSIGARSFHLTKHQRGVDHLKVDIRFGRRIGTDRHGPYRDQLRARSSAGVKPLRKLGAASAAAAIPLGHEVDEGMRIGILSPPVPTAGGDFALQTALQPVPNSSGYGTIAL